MKNGKCPSVASVVIVVVAIVLLTRSGAIAAPAAGQPDDEYTLQPSLPPGQPVGTTIIWTAATAGTPPDGLLYQFSVRPGGGPLRMVRDFKPDNFFEWTPIDEGDYDVLVIVQGAGAEPIAQATASYSVTSRLSGENAVVTLTQHPLVFLYSAPPCQDGALRVAFRPVDSTEWTYTSWKPCQAGKSVNIYVAGMLADTTYELHHELKTGNSIQASASLQEKTGTLEDSFPLSDVLTEMPAEMSPVETVLFQSPKGSINGKMYPVATDLSGRILWYYKFRTSENPGFPWHFGQYMVRPLPGGTLLLVLNYDGTFSQILREVDLAGNPLQETNVETVNRQLAARGQERIGVFHHDAVRLPNGYTLVMGTVEHLLTDVQGPGELDVLGDMLIALDENLQVVWTWNSFDHLDVTRKAVLNELCRAGTFNCALVFRAPVANDWTHTNTIAYLPQDGNLLLSIRNQDWVIKVDYRDGAGTGNILWRLGPDGDFTLSTGDPDQWFTHQHDVHFEGNQLLVFDNGNTRCQKATTACYSRGQAWVIDEKTMVAHLVLNADLGTYSAAYGSAQRLANGNYHFLSGTIAGDVAAQSVEVRPDGTRVFVIETRGAVVYRSFRVSDLYSVYGAGDANGGEPAAKVFLPWVIGK